jgi:hypothetical protein
MYARVSLTGAVLVPKIEANYWQVVVRVVPDKNFTDSKIKITVPTAPAGIELARESFVSHGLAAGVVESQGMRTLIWRGSRRKKKPLELSYTAVIRKGTKNIQIPDRTLDFANRISLFKKTELPKIEKVLKLAKQRYSDNPRALADFFRECIDRASCGGVDISSRLRKSEELAATAIAELLRASGVRAVAASGFHVPFAEKGAIRRYWVRMESGDESFNFYPKTAQGLKTGNLVFWSWVYPVKKKREFLAPFDVSYSIVPVDSEIQSGARDHRNDAWRYFSLRSLPAPTQATYRAMLLIPLGALVMSLFRSFFGFATFGTFMPVLFALSFMDMGLKWGLVLLSLVVIFGVIVRSLLNSLQLLLVPRLATTLSLVVLLVLLVSKVSFEMGFSPGLSVTLFPIIILTMIVERVSISWDEVGAKATLTLFVSSILAAVLCYFAMSPSLVHYWVFSFPEVTLLFIGLNIALGRYTGYRLVEYSRFKVLT